ncbi:MAG: hypothetical protein P1V20_20120 [Verrucomicrobiales bacterium]|nr:hypothetical protein [Verrucomicrobiales bacterium]
MMSPKYRLRPTTQLTRDGNIYRTERRAHTLFLPAMMIAVVGMTFLLVATTEPVALPGLDLASTPVVAKQIPEPASEKIELPVPVESAPPVVELASVKVASEKFVSRKKLAVVEPLPVTAIAGKALIVDSVTDSGPQPVETIQSAYTSGLPAPGPVVQHTAVPNFFPVQEQKRQSVLSVGTGEIPTARLALGREHQCAVPIIEAVKLSHEFTPWMTPEELNRHILAKSCGKSRSFWEAGNWITAVEGRLDKDGVQRFRIVHEKSPQTANYRWHYCIALSREDFGRKIDAGSRSGFRLVQSQMYMDSENEPRFQAVWHRL